MEKAGGIAEAFPMCGKEGGSEGIWRTSLCVPDAPTRETGELPARRTIRAIASKPLIILKGMKEMPATAAANCGDSEAGVGVSRRHRPKVDVNLSLPVPLKTAYQGTGRLILRECGVSDIRGLNRKEEMQVFRLRLSRKRPSFAQDDSTILTQTLETGH